MEDVVLRGAAAAVGGLPRLGRGGRGRLQPARPRQQPCAAGPHHLPDVRHAGGEHRVPQQDHAREAHHLHREHGRRPPVVGHPVPRRERLGKVVDRHQSHVHQEPDAEHHDAPYLFGLCRMRAQRHDDRRRQGQQIQGGDRSVQDHGNQCLRVARLRELQRHPAPDPDREADRHAGRDHAAGEVVEPGVEVDPRAFAGEHPQDHRREQERGHVQIEEEPARRGQVQEMGRQLLGRRQIQEERREHVQLGVRGLEQAVDSQQPGSRVVPAGQQQQARARRMPHQLGRHVDGDLAVLAPVVSPGPRQQHQRRGHLDHGDGDEGLRGEAHEGAVARVGAGGRRRLRSRLVGGDERGERAEVAERTAIGRRGQLLAPLPLNLPVQRQGVRHVVDEIVVLFAANRHAVAPLPRGRFRQHATDLTRLAGRPATRHASSGGNAPFAQ